MSVYTMVGSPDVVAVSSSSGTGSSLATPPITASAASSASAYVSTEGNGSSFYDDMASAGAHEHVGCFVDSRSGRMLRGDSTKSSNMTPSRCSAFCSEGGHDAFNLQYGTE